MRLLWETMHLPLVIAMVALTQFSQKVGSCGFAGYRFSLTTLSIPVDLSMDRSIGTAVLL
jgi:hypothetical protein